LPSAIYVGENGGREDLFLRSINGVAYNICCSVFRRKRKKFFFCLTAIFHKTSLVGGWGKKKIFFCIKISQRPRGGEGNFPSGGLINNFFCWRRRFLCGDNNIPRAQRMWGGNLRFPRGCLMRVIYFFEGGGVFFILERPWGVLPPSKKLLSF